MKYFVINNFIHENFAKDLIIEANKIINFDKEINIHKNRAFLSSTSISFNKLIKLSKSWDSLEKKINSEDFLKFCLDKVNVDKSKYCLKNYFKKKNLLKNDIIYKKISESRVKLIPTLSIFKFLIYRIYKNFIRIIKYSKIFYPKKKPLELLFDFSRAGNGYINDVHKDSNSRFVVFILYLNSLEINEHASGGDFHVHRKIKDEKNLSTPILNSYETIDVIKPAPGKLIIFLNEDDAYHSVNEMKNFDGYRYFLYGGFTFLSDKSENIKKEKSKTEFHLYD